MKWRTKISTKKNGSLYIRGKALSTLTHTATFTEVSFLLLAERMPSKKELALFDMMLVSAVEHGIEVPSAFSSRTSASVGNELQVAAAAGLLSVGKYHGGAVEDAAHMLNSNETPAEIVRRALGTKVRHPGLGHAFYKKTDPRTEALFKKAKLLGIPQTHIARIREIQAELKKQSGKELPINIDGALAALLLALKFDPHIANGIFALARMPGILAHAVEERTHEKPYRRLPDEDVEYYGSKI